MLVGVFAIATNVVVVVLVYIPVLAAEKQRLLPAQTQPANHSTHKHDFRALCVLRARAKKVKSTIIRYSDSYV